MTAQIEHIKPDTGFIKQITSLGGESLKKCFQCGTCSVACSLSPQEKPFPRKEMIWAQWGLKDRLLKDPDIWLCHQCNDCSSKCPRGAKPGDVLAAIRNYSITYFAAPKFLSQAFSKLRYLPIFIAVPAVIFLTLFLLANGGFNFPEGEVVFSNLVPYAFVGSATSLATVFAAIIAAIGLHRFWKNISESEINMTSTPKNPVAAQTKKNLLRNFGLSLIDILKHNKFAQCETNKIRYFAHLGMLYGFILVLLSHMGIGLYLMAGIYQLKGEDSFPSLLDPFVMIGNIGFVFLLTGCLLVIYNRLSKNGNAGKTTYFDWFFIALLSSVTVAGILVEATRIAQMVNSAYTLWLIHEVLVFSLIAYMPFSKFAHLLYRTLAMTYARQIGREATTDSVMETL